MNYVLDTNLVIKNDNGQSKVPHFKYDELDNILRDKNNKIFIAEFALFEIFNLRHYKTVQDVNNFLFANDLGVLQIDIYDHKDGKVFKFSNNPIENAGAKVFYTLTQFIEFYVYHLVVTDGRLFDPESDNHQEVTDSVAYYSKQFYEKYGKVCGENITYFMKYSASEYIVEVIINVYKKYGVVLNKNDVWQMASKMKISKNYSTENVDINFIQYGNYLSNYFGLKLKSKAQKAPLTFGMVDVLQAKISTEKDYLFLSADKNLCEYILRYGNPINKAQTLKMWDANTLELLKI